MDQRFEFFNATTGLGASRPTLDEAVALADQRADRLDEWAVVEVRDGEVVVPAVAYGIGPPFA
jgi:hypothetical protein